MIRRASESLTGMGDKHPPLEELVWDNGGGERKIIWMKHGGHSA